MTPNYWPSLKYGRFSDPYILFNSTWNLDMYLHASVSGEDLCFWPSDLHLSIIIFHGFSCFVLWWDEKDVIISETVRSRCSRVLVKVKNHDKDDITHTEPTYPLHHVIASNTWPPHPLGKTYQSFLEKS